MDPEVLREGQRVLLTRQVEALEGGLALQSQSFNLE
jgi:hypothetical protein